MAALSGALAAAHAEDAVAPAAGVLLVLMGLPASGKSTAAAALVRLTASRPDLSLEVISFDDHLAATGALEADEFDAGKWHASRRSALDAVRAALDGAEPVSPLAEWRGTATRRTRVVVADDNAQYRSMRHTLFVAARDRKYAFATAFFECDVDEALARNGSRPSAARVPPATIEAMARQLEPPEPREGGWERRSRTLLGTRDGVEAANALLRLVSRGARRGGTSTYLRLEYVAILCFSKEHPRTEAWRGMVARPRMRWNVRARTERGASEGES